MMQKKLLVTQSQIPQFKSQALLLKSVIEDIYQERFSNFKVMDGLARAIGYKNASSLYREAPETGEELTPFYPILHNGVLEAFARNLDLSVNISIKQDGTDKILNALSTFFDHMDTEGYDRIEGGLADKLHGALIDINKLRSDFSVKIVTHPKMQAFMEVANSALKNKE